MILSGSSGEEWQMAVDVVKNVAIKGIAAAVPPHIKRSDEYADMIGEKAVQKFIETVGIRQRHIGDGKIMTSDLCCAAAEELIGKLQLDRREIDAVIAVTQTGDYIAPAAACILQERLQLSCDCMAYDIAMGCSGYVYGLYNAAAHLQNGHIKKILLLVGDSLSYMASPYDHGQMMLAGDAGTATLLEYEAGAADMQFLFRTIGAGYKSLIVPYGGYKHKYGCAQQKKREDGIIRSDYDTFMDGVEVFKFSIKEVPASFQDYFKEYESGEADYDYVIFHQANRFIIQNIAKRLKIPASKVPLSLEKYGNTSSATIPLTLCDFFGDKKKEEAFQKKKILMSGFGVGLSVGIAGLELDPQTCFPVIETDKTFDDRIDELHQNISSLIEK